MDLLNFTFVSPFNHDQVKCVKLVFLAGFELTITIAIHNSQPQPYYSKSDTLTIKPHR